jgi:hypothetical protein
MTMKDWQKDIDDAVDCIKNIAQLSINFSDLVLYTDVRNNIQYTYKRVPGILVYTIMELLEDWEEQED